MTTKTKAPWLAEAATDAASTESSATAAANVEGGTTPPADPVAPPVTPTANPVILQADPVEEVKDETMVTVTVPKAFKLRIDVHTELQINAGVQEMSIEQANHWYSKANGVVIYSK